ncbi:hypothetical protein [Nocardia sp. NPDC002869]|uniref:hypothetical protein n=1 Tax=Nocardia sp. NPDC002869 TaxID=3161032 RepID=UPI00398CA7D8
MRRIRGVLTSPAQAERTGAPPDGMPVADSAGSAGVVADPPEPGHLAGRCVWTNRDPL